jgi:hypothetical protein
MWSRGVCIYQHVSTDMVVILSQVKASGQQLQTQSQLVKCKTHSRSQYLIKAWHATVLCLDTDSIHGRIFVPLKAAPGLPYFMRYTHQRIQETTSISSTLLLLRCCGH